MRSVCTVHEMKIAGSPVPAELPIFPSGIWLHEKHSEERKSEKNGKQQKRSKNRKGENNMDLKDKLIDGLVDSLGKEIKDKLEDAGDLLKGLFGKR